MSISIIGIVQMLPLTIQLNVQNVVQWHSAAFEVGLDSRVRWRRPSQSARDTEPSPLVRPILNLDLTPKLGTFSYCSHGGRGLEIVAGGAETGLSDGLRPARPGHN